MGKMVITTDLVLCGRAVRKVQTERLEIIPITRPMLLLGTVEGMNHLHVAGGIGVWVAAMDTSL